MWEVTLKHIGIDRLFGWIGNGESEDFIKSIIDFGDTFWVYNVSNSESLLGSLKGFSEKSNKTGRYSRWRDV